MFSWTPYERVHRLRCSLWVPRLVELSYLLERFVWRPHSALPVRPRTAGVQGVPPTRLTLLPRGTLIMIPEPIKTQIPDRLVVIDQEALGECDPDGDDCQVAALEVRDLEILSFAHRFGVFPRSDAGALAPLR